MTLAGNWGYLSWVRNKTNILQQNRTGQQNTFFFPFLFCTRVLSLFDICLVFYTLFFSAG